MLFSQLYLSPVRNALGKDERRSTIVLDRNQNRTLNARNAEEIPHSSGRKGGGTMNSTLRCGEDVIDLPARIEYFGNEDGTTKVTIMNAEGATVSVLKNVHEPEILLPTNADGFRTVTFTNTEGATVAPTKNEADFGASSVIDVDDDTLETEDRLLQWQVDKVVSDFYIFLDLLFILLSVL